MTDAKEYLQYFRNMKARIDLKEQQFHDLHDRLTCMSPSFDAELVSHSKNVAVMSDTIAILIDMRNEIDQQLSDFWQKKHEAYRLLDQISPEGARILIEYYFNRKSLSECGLIYHIAKRQAQRRLNEAIAEFQEILNKSGA